MPGGDGGFGPEDFVDGENALESPDQQGFVQLRALRKIGLMIKVFDPKNLRPSFGDRRNDRRSLEFHESPRLKSFAEAIDDDFLNFEYSPNLRMAENQSAMV